MSNQPKGYYVLEVKSITGDNFEGTKSLHMNTKKYSTFIQTDKSIYKPGDNVKFRVFVLDAETKPFKFEDIEIYITDGGRNRVKQFENPKGNFIKGVYQNELQLSDSPVMGKWHIHVKLNNGSSKAKEFEVKEYILPKFELTIDAEPGANYKDGIIRATVKAKYTFGKFAKGTAKVTALVDRRYFAFGSRRMVDESVQLTKLVEVDGKKFVEFDILHELKMNKSRYDSRVTLKATFVEEITQKEVNVTKVVHVHPSPYKLEVLSDENTIKPGLPIKVTAKLTSHDKDMPVTDAHNPVKFGIKYKYDILRTCIRREYPDDFDPWFKARNKNSTVTQRTLTEDDIVKTEYECREVRSVDEAKEVFPKNGFAEIFVEISGNYTEIEVEVRNAYF